MSSKKKVYKNFKVEARVNQIEYDKLIVYAEKKQISVSEAMRQLIQNIDFTNL